MRTITAIELQRLVNSFDGANGWLSNTAYIHWTDKDGEHGCEMVKIEDPAQLEYLLRLQDRILGQQPRRQVPASRK